jgi:hypothetical protein
MKNILALIILSSLVISCKKIEGQLTVDKSFELVDRRGRMVKLDIDQYDVTLQEKRRYLKVVIKGANSQRRVIKFDINDQNTIPENDGPFRILTSESGQPMDIDGYTETQHEWLDEMSGRENCLKTEREHRCTTHGPRGGMTCRMEQVTRPGHRQVTYKAHNILKIIEANLLDPANNNIYGQFVFENQTQVRDYSYEGLCR